MPIPGNTSTSAYVTATNTNVSFVFHSLRVGGAKYRFDIQFFDTDLIDSLGKDHCDILGIGLGVHFLQWSKYAIIQRISHLKGAISRLRERCPQSFIFIKGPHLSGKIGRASISGILMRSEVFVYNIVELMKQQFRNINVAFIDTIDINLATLRELKLHMQHEIVLQELFLALSYLCKGAKRHD